MQKEPALTLYFPEILTLIPNSVFVVMVRDPRDTVASKVSVYQKENRKRFEVKKLLQEYIFYYSRILENRHMFGDRLLFVNYEKLVLDTDDTMERLRNFTNLDLPINPKSDKWETTRNPMTNPYASVLDGRPISNSSIGKYKELLSRKDSQYIESYRNDIESLFGFKIFEYDKVDNHYKEQKSRMTIF